MPQQPGLMQCSYALTSSEASMGSKHMDLGIYGRSRQCPERGQTAGSHLGKLVVMEGSS